MFQTKVVERKTHFMFSVIFLPKFLLFMR